MMMIVISSARCYSYRYPIGISVGVRIGINIGCLSIFHIFSIFILLSGAHIVILTYPRSL